MSDELGKAIDDLRVYMRDLFEENYGLKRKNTKLKQDIKELVDLGTDQVVTEKILRLESDNKKLRDILSFVYSEFRAYQTGDGFMQEVWAIINDPKNKKLIIK